MNDPQTPTGLAAATKVTLDAVKTTFGAAIVVLLFCNYSARFIENTRKFT